MTWADWCIDRHLEELPEVRTREVEQLVPPAGQHGSDRKEREALDLLGRHGGRDGQLVTLGDDIDERWTPVAKGIPERIP